MAQRRTLQPQVRARIRNNWAHLKTAVGKGSACELLEAEGGQYAVLRVRGERPDEELAIEILRKAHTLVHPGHFYDFPSEGNLVVSLITPETEFQRGVSCFLEYVKKEN